MSASAKSRDELYAEQIEIISNNPLPKSTFTNGNGAHDSDAWKKQLRKRGDRYIGDESNLLHALRREPKFSGLVRYNEFQNRTEFARCPPWRTAAVGDPWTDADDTDARALLIMQGFDLGRPSTVADCLHRVSRDQPYHPVRSFLAPLSWDGEPRLQLWLIDYLGAEASNPGYLAAVGIKFLVSAVARIMAPGCKVDHVLTLEGAQGSGKSTAVRILGEPWVIDYLPDLADKDAAQQLPGAWFIELPELAALRRSEIEATKAFLSRPIDRYRPSYGRHAIDVPRQSVFVATTNEGQYLRDPTGNRRFWPVSCGRIDTHRLADDRDQLFAEAKHRYLSGEPWHLTDAEARHATREQAARVVVTELEQMVGEYLDQLTADGKTETDVRSVLIWGLRLSPDDPNFIERAKRLGAEVAHALVRSGWNNAGRHGRGESRRTVYRKL